MYWNERAIPPDNVGQNCLAENDSRITTDPPPARTAPDRQHAPTLWYIGRQLYMRSSGRVSNKPANHRLHCKSLAWLMLAAFGRPVVPDV